MSRDSIAFREVADEAKRSKVGFAFWFAKNWFLERLAQVWPMPGGRARLHRWRGVRIGKGVYIGYDVIFDRLHPGLITVEDGAEIGDRSIISAHQRGSLALRDRFPRKIDPVVIGAGAWVMPGCIIAPGVHVGERAAVATGSVVTKDVPPNTLVGGVPAKILRDYREPAAAPAAPKDSSAVTG
jgi:acetyltransferase-like isoleucine patch superfamily enzyme